MVSEVPSHLREAIGACAAGREPWPLFVHGGVGTGKTCAALCLLDRAGGEYFTAGELCEKMNLAAFGKLEIEMSHRKTHDFDPIAFAVRFTPERFRKVFLQSPPLVVLDELGTRGKVTDAAYETIYGAIEARAGKPFVAIANHSLTMIDKLYDARLASRLGAGTIVEVAGADRRLV